MATTATAHYPVQYQEIVPKVVYYDGIDPAPFLEFASSKHQSVLEYLDESLNLTNAKVYSHNCSRADLSTTYQDAGWTRRLDRSWICLPCKNLNHNKGRHKNEYKQMHGGQNLADNSAIHLSSNQQ